MRTSEEVRKQLKEAREDYRRERNSRTLGYVEALEWVLYEE